MPGFPKRQPYFEVSEKIGQLKLQTFDGIADAFNKWAKKKIWAFGVNKYGE